MTDKALIVGSSPDDPKGLEAKIKELEANQIKGRCKDCKHTEYCEWLASDGSGYCSEFEPKEAVKEGKI